MYHTTSPADAMMGELRKSFHEIMQKFADNTDSVISGDTDINLEVSPMGSELYFEFTIGTVLGRDKDNQKNDDDNNKEGCKPHLRLL